MPTDPWLLGYVGAFGLAAVASFASLGRLERIDDSDTRRGLTWLLLTSGGWSLAHVGYLLVPTRELKLAFYVAGLVVGLSTVGPWLYFCSAYTGRSLHHDRRLRGVMVAAFLAIVAVKVTNPYHSLYFTAELLETPFTHLAIRHGFAHWIVMGLSYALATVGYFMLLELFVQVSYDTKPLVALVSITGLPVVLDLVGLASPALLDMTYEPLGVAVFAVGVTFVYLDRFRTLRLAAGHDDATVVLAADGTIREFNDSAADQFSELRDADLGDPFHAVLPAVADALGRDDEIFEREEDGTVRYYRLAEHPFAPDRAQLGSVVTLADVSHREQYRRELERQNDRLDQFASMVSHDLRNPLNVATGRLEIAREERDSEHLAVVADALARMEALIGDVLHLARQGQPVEETEVVDLRSVAEGSWALVETPEADLRVERDLSFRADPDRLQRLFENLFRNAIDHGSETVTVRVGALEDGEGFFVADDGPGIPEAERDQVFESGYTTDEDGTGFGLSIVAEIADAHGWEVGVTEGADGGARFEVRGVTVLE